LLVALLCACAPALDWRVVKPPGMELQATFPCRPAGLSREVALLGQRVEMAMHACAAQGNTFAISALVVSDVRDVGAALDALRDAAAHNVGVAAAPMQPLAVPGMTPNVRAGRSTLSGRRPDGSAVAEHLALFTRGTRVYQAMVVGDRPQETVVDLFFAGLALSP
jgi:hypothetical protein